MDLKNNEIRDSNDRTGQHNPQQVKDIRKSNK